MRRLVYLAGPISGLTYEGAQDWRDIVSEQLNSPLVECLTPMRGKSFLADGKEIASSGYANPIASSKGVTRRDMFDTHRATCLFVNFLGAKKVSIGTCMELAWAYKAQIPTIVLMEPDNVHHHIMLDETCTYIVGTIKEGIELTKFLMNSPQ